MDALQGAFLTVSAPGEDYLRRIAEHRHFPSSIRSGVARTPRLAQPPKTPVGAGQVDATRQASLPAEVLHFTLKLDASDQLAESNPIAARQRYICRRSRALELLMVPKSVDDDRSLEPGR